MLALERRNLILEKLQEDKRVVVSELSQLYNVSEETIRRDLDKLDRDGLAIKSYGGAIINESTSIDMPFNVRKNRNVSGKQKIGEIVASLIHDGDHIMLDASTTAVFIAKAIKLKERLTVITNSIEVMIELSDVSEWTIISSGGTLKEGYLALVGPLAVQGLSSYNVDTCFFSCKGFELNKGFTDSNEQFSQAKQVMIQCAKKRVLAIDNSKFGTISFSKAGDFKDIDVVVTDQRPDEIWMETFKNHGIECLYPED
ncbi:MAG: DeoR/GlpR family DNA-binding transcription regulator [Lachnospiraceae bacterium]|nr:DeoR/GlpR family DNA-binding transcription regulator [Lachnospiraceae bacterium]MDD3614875.1 DeoR/GlpR family DNA-binding transcription regulator [Lachnospiraceae bacterium]